MAKKALQRLYNLCVGTWETRDVVMHSPGTQEVKAGGLEVQGPARLGNRTQRKKWQR